MGMNNIEVTSVCCDWCGKQEIIEYTGETAKQLVRKKGYVITTHVVTEYVLCKNCAR